MNLQFKTMKITNLPPTKGLYRPDKIGPTSPSNVVLFAYNVVVTVLVGYKFPFGRQIKLKLSPPLPHSLKYFFFVLTSDALGISNSA